MTPEFEKLLDPQTRKVVARLALRCMTHREEMEEGVDYDCEEQGIIHGWNSCRDMIGYRLIDTFGDPSDEGEHNPIARAVFGCLPHFEQIAPGEELPAGERDFIQGRNSMLEEVREALFQLFVDPSYVRVPFTTTPNP